MRVLIVNDYANHSGGAEVAAHGLRAGLRRRGHDARLFASRAGAGAAVEADDSTFGTTSRARGLVQCANPVAARDLRRVVRRFRPDVVHVKLFLTQLSPLILPVLREVPAVRDIVWYRAICPTGLKTLPSGEECHVQPGRVCLRTGCVPAQDWPGVMGQLALARRWSDVFDTVIANSTAAKELLLESGVEVDHVLAHGAREAPRSLPGPVPLVTFSGRLERSKGADVLIAAFARILREVPDAHLLVAGDGPEAPALRQQAAALGIADSVTFSGHVAREDLDERLAGAWAHVVPSRWREPFGRSAAEAMMRGVAVVASHTGGLAEQVEHGRTGLLTRPGDERALAAALASLLADCEVAQAFGDAGRERAHAHLSEERSIERLLDIYRDTIERAHA